MSYSFHGDYRYKALEYLVSTLANDPYISSIVGNRVYSQHISTMEQPIYPCVTISRQGIGADPSLAQIDSAFIAIDVWSKKANSECWAIYASKDPTTFRNLGIFALLHNQGFDFTEVQIDRLWEVYLTDSLYEGDTRTFHLAARYEMKYVGKNVTTT